MATLTSYGWSPRSYDISFSAGRDFEFGFQLKNEDDEAYDISGWTPWAQINSAVDGSGSTLATFTFDTSALSTGIIIMKLDHTVTSGLAETGQSKRAVDIGYYDLTIDDGSGRYLALLYGKVTVINFFSALS